ncbi:hypothetical protein [Halomonas sp. M4R1S46]|uniref:hypothetical protein n=1 Tax=Halomonas sp. M4R1S46 TaxID=2982692 RepID=UPI0021E45DF3|nr:hypothetical protein [Halomonas sp. M4R1S46]UYG08054.1 hypothetical protein OCT48_01510 [Halomonas sp. M4R1S46]
MSSSLREPSDIEIIQMWDRLEKIYQCMDEAAAVIGETSQENYAIWTFRGSWPDVREHPPVALDNGDYPKKARFFLGMVWDAAMVLLDSVKSIRLLSEIERDALLANLAGIGGVDMQLLGEPLSWRLRRC